MVIVHSTKILTGVQSFSKCPRGIEKKGGCCYFDWTCIHWLQGVQANPFKSVQTRRRLYVAIHLASFQLERPVVLAIMFPTICPSFIRGYSQRESKCNHSFDCCLSMLVIQVLDRVLMWDDSQECETSLIGFANFVM